MLLVSIFRFQPRELLKPDSSKLIYKSQNCQKRKMLSSSNSSSCTSSRAEQSVINPKLLLRQKETGKIKGL